MGKNVSTRILEESEYAAWNLMISKSAQGSIYSRPEYLDILCRAAGGGFRLLGCYIGEELVGGIGLYEGKWRLGTVVTNRLLLYYNGIVLAPHDTTYPSQKASRELEIAGALEMSLSDTSHSAVILHNCDSFTEYRPFLERGWTATPSYSYVMSIATPEEMWSRVEQNQRRLVNRCESTGVISASDDDFDSFYAMHEATHVRKGAPLYLPREAFRKYFSALKELGWCRLYHARLPEGRSVASQLVLACSHPKTHTVCAAADPEQLKIGATPFLRIKVCEDLSRLGYAENDLTDAALNPVTRFKSQLGGDLRLSHVLTSRSSMSYRFWSGIERGYSRGKAAAAKAARALVGRNGGDE